MKRNPIPFNLSLASMVARTGKTINLAKNEATGTHNVQFFNSFMCMAIREPDGKILGVISLIDKDSGCHSAGFSANDERYSEPILCEIGNWQSKR